jgi:hypothetical protein
MFSSIVGCDFDDITIGMPVEVTFERQDDTITLPMFTPVPEQPRS